MKELTGAMASGTNSRTKMAQKLLLAALALAFPTVALAGDQAAYRMTAKGVEPFARCFAAAQEKASKPWSFVPREGGGGTFSNGGARGVGTPYFVRILDDGHARDIRVDAPRADSDVRRAVDRCI